VYQSCEETDVTTDIYEPRRGESDNTATLTLKIEPTYFQLRKYKLAVVKNKSVQRHIIPSNLQITLPALPRSSEVIYAFKFGFEVVVNIPKLSKSRNEDIACIVLSCSDQSRCDNCDN